MLRPLTDSRMLVNSDNTYFSHFPMYFSDWTIKFDVKEFDHMVYLFMVEQGCVGEMISDIRDLSDSNCPG